MRIRNYLRERRAFYYCPPVIVNVYWLRCRPLKATSRLLGRGNESQRRLLSQRLDPNHGASMQCHGKDERCHDCPFARRFVYRCGRHHGPRSSPLCCWRSPYPNHPSVWHYLRGFQCCSLHMVFRREGVHLPPNVTLSTTLGSYKTLIGSNP